MQEVYTDGACSASSGIGGWAWIIDQQHFAAGHHPHTTNQRMEIRAALEAVRTIPGELVVVSDSAYVVNCFLASWWVGWLRNGWRTSSKKPVANRDLWEPLIHLVRMRDDVTFRWVKGHSGHPMNDAVDALAVEAKLSQRSFSEYGPEPATTPRAPDPLGPCPDCHQLRDTPVHYYVCEKSE